MSVDAVYIEASNLVESRREYDIDRVPSVSGCGAGRDLLEARGSSQDPSPKGHSVSKRGKALLGSLLALLLT